MFNVVHAPAAPKRPDYTRSSYSTSRPDRPPIAMEYGQSIYSPMHDQKFIRIDAHVFEDVSDRIIARLWWERDCLETDTLHRLEKEMVKRELLVEVDSNGI